MNNGNLASMKTCKPLILLSFLFLTFSARSGVIRGGEVTYRFLGDLSYEVTYTMYRDCGDTSFHMPDSAARIQCGTGTDSEPLDLYLVSISRILTCMNDTSTCLPQNTPNTGSAMERHVYRAIVSLKSTEYKRFANCDEVVFSIELCCRSVDFTNTGTGAYYNFATLNLKDAADNSSPVFGRDPIGYIPCNVGTYLSHGVSDTINFDSVSYSLANPLKSKGSVIAYNSGFSKSLPLTVYDPLKNGSISPKANPPIGFYFDSLTGDFVFTPVQCNEVSLQVIEVTEWRKDSSGIRVPVGTIRRDMSWITFPAPGNNPPEIKGPYKYEVCAGDRICFNVLSDDITVIPPPPAPIPDDDTVTITWNYGIPGATFSVIDPKALHQTGRFCWTTPLESGRLMPWSFTVTARDDACPRNLITDRSFTIHVNPTPDVDLGKDTAIGPGKKVTLNAGPGGTTYLWNTGDTTQTIVADTFGTYWVEVSNNCGTSSDTIEVNLLTGIPRLKQEPFVLFPNPSRGDFKMNAGSYNGTLLVTILDMQGREIMEEKNHEKGEDGMYHVQPDKDLTPGIYLVRVMDENQKVIKALLMVNDAE